MSATRPCPRACAYGNGSVNGSSSANGAGPGPLYGSAGRFTFPLKTVVVLEPRLLAKVVEAAAALLGPTDMSIERVAVAAGFALPIALARRKWIAFSTPAAVGMSAVL